MLVWGEEDEGEWGAEEGPWTLEGILEALSDLLLYQT